MGNKLGPAAVTVALALAAAACSASEPNQSASSPTTEAVVSPTAEVPTSVPTEPPTRPSSGAEPLDPPTPPAPRSDPEGAWVLDPVPFGFRPMLASDEDGERIVRYQRIDRMGDLYDSPLAVVTVVGAAAQILPPFNQRSVQVGDREIVVAELRGDGEHYGTFAVEEVAAGQFVGIGFDEPFADGWLLEWMSDLRHLSEPEWRDLLVATGIQFEPGMNDDHDRVELASLELDDGTRAELRALVPQDYPADVDDRRRMCIDVTVGLLSIEDCEPGPGRLTIRDEAVVWGPVSNPAIAAVDVRRVDLTGEPVGDEVITAPVHRPGDIPGGAYLLTVPAEWCLVDVAAEGGAADAVLGLVGVFPNDERYERCLDELPQPTR